MFYGQGCNELNLFIYLSQTTFCGDLITVYESFKRKKKADIKELLGAWKEQKNLLAARKRSWIESHQSKATHFNSGDSLALQVPGADQMQFKTHNSKTQLLL